LISGTREIANVIPLLPFLLQGTEWLIVIVVAAFIMLGVVSLIVWLVLGAVGSMSRRRAPAGGSFGRFCSQCGKGVEQETRFCPNCGKQL
jgi:hypothetical protein